MANREHSVQYSRCNSPLDAELVLADVAAVREAGESKMDEAVDPSRESKRGGRAVSNQFQSKGEKEELTVLPSGSVASAQEAPSYQVHVQSQIV